MVQKKNTLTKTGIVALLACVCCILWGSAIPVIKTGYRLMEVDAADTASQIEFAGIRFTLAGLLVLIFASIREKKVLIPDRTILKYAVPVCLAQTVGQYFFFYHRCCPHFRSKRRHYHRTWQLYCDTDGLPDCSKRTDDWEKNGGLRAWICWCGCDQPDGKVPGYGIHAYR